VTPQWFVTIADGSRSVHRGPFRSPYMAAVAFWDAVAELARRLQDPRRVGDAREVEWYGRRYAGEFWIQTNQFPLRDDGDQIRRHDVSRGPCHVALRPIHANSRRNRHAMQRRTPPVTLEEMELG